MLHCCSREASKRLELSYDGCCWTAPTSRRLPISTIRILATNSVLIDDRLLVAHLLDAKLALPRRAELYTTAYWYYRACRAAIAGGAGQLSGPFRALHPDEQAQAIQGLLQLPESIGLPESRHLVPEMADVSRRHPQLNLLNVEATAAARQLSARVLLSPPAARGVLGDVLVREEISWEAVEPG